MYKKENGTKLSPIEMAGLFLTLFEKNEYCANQIAAVLELVNRRFEEHRNLEPIKFETARGRATEIVKFQDAIFSKYFST